ncbi:hypothetical protein F5Y15DRAFT_31876 [Xylariaceae sp. FL0016]|nr:hypothetical protein F5Y15DRAFT_31876 [Xylariaceae sp. FL0016]
MMLLGRFYTAKNWKKNNAGLILEVNTVAELENEITARGSKFIPFRERRHRVISSVTKEIFSLSEKLIRSRRPRLFGRLLLQDDEEVKAAIERLEELCKGENRLLSALSYGTSQKVERDLISIKADTEKKSSELLVEKTRSLFDKYFLTSPHEKNVRKFLEYEEAVLKGTGKWFLDNEKFQKWIHDQIPALWVSGGPGTRKSSLCAIAIRYFTEAQVTTATEPRRAESSRENVHLAHFFVEEDDTQQRDTLNLLRSLAYQTLEQDITNPIIPKLPRESLEACGPPKKLWQNIIQRVMDLYASSERKLLTTCLGWPR